jgi:rubredoxin
MTKCSILLISLVLSLLCLSSNAFTTPSSSSIVVGGARRAFVVGRAPTSLFMTTEEPMTTAVSVDPMDEALIDVDEGTRRAMEKAKRAEELRAQEVFMKKSTGLHKCTNCDWEYDQAKGDSMMIGGQIKPGTKFNELPDNWRCPVCRASKDAFMEVVEEIPGFEVNQGYGFGTNSWSAGQKNSAIFGGLAFFFALFIGGYGLS